MLSGTDGPVVFESEALENIPKASRRVSARPGLTRLVNGIDFDDIQAKGRKGFLGYPQSESGSLVHSLPCRGRIRAFSSTRGPSSRTFCFVKQQRTACSKAAEDAVMGDRLWQVSSAMTSALSLSAKA